jgi:hypothetical protein
MNYQVYFLTVAYLLVGGGVLLGDEYGGRSHLLLRLKNSVNSSKLTHLIFIIVGLFVTFWKIFLPIPPGPPLLGDFVPTLATLILTIYYLVRLKRLAGGREEKELAVVKHTSSYLERNKRNLGFFLVAVALLHFLFPQAVLI